MEPPSFFLHTPQVEAAQRMEALAGVRPPPSLSGAARCVASIIEGAVLISCSAAMKENHPYLLLMAPSGGGCRKQRSRNLQKNHREEVRVIKQDLNPPFRLVFGERGCKSQAETLLTELHPFFSLFSLQKLL